MKLIIGLGNPGNEYSNTRHNVGFMVIDNYCNKNKLVELKNKFNGLFIKTKINDEDIIFLKPQKYMNLSGEVVRDFINFYKINTNDILVINDDLDLNIGSYKLKPSGSSGGHNGLKNIENNIGTKNYKRLKIGISNNKMIETKDYVLGNFNTDEKKLLDKVIIESENIINDFIKYDFDKVMNKYNGKKENL